MIDVLLPYYGDPGYLRAAVRSVLAQTSPDWRLVVTDDCYPDDSIGPWFASLDDDRIDYSRNATNLGANLNYQHALSRATADWVVVMGADDLMLPGYIARLHELVARFGTTARVVQPGVEVVDEHDDVVRTRVDVAKARARPATGRDDAVVVSGEDVIGSLLRANWTYFPSLCWHRETITAIGFRPQFHVVQDLALLVDLLRGGGGLVVDDEVTFRYRRHAGSDSSLKTVLGSRFAEERQYFATIGGELARDGMPHAARAARLHVTSRLHALSLLPSAARTGRPGAVGRLLRHALAPG